MTPCALPLAPHERNSMLRHTLSWIRREYWWHASRRVSLDALCWRLAWLIPRRIAYLCFVRVYASSGEGPGPEYTAACKAWESGAGR